jgi:hypothetical protein
VFSPAVGGTGPGARGREYLSGLDAALAADITSMRWLRFQRGPFGKAPRSLVSR